jgi:hypothetical protein
LYAMHLVDGLSVIWCAADILHNEVADRRVDFWGD